MAFVWNVCTFSLRTVAQSWTIFVPQSLYSLKYWMFESKSNYRPHPKDGERWCFQSVHTRWGYLPWPRRYLPWPGGEGVPTLARGSNYLGWGVPTLAGGSPPWGTPPPDRTADGYGVLDMLRSVCLLRSSRRTSCWLHVCTVFHQLLRSYQVEYSKRLHESVVAMENFASYHPLVTGTQRWNFLPLKVWI